MEEPIPSIFITSLCIFAVLIMFTLGKPKFGLKDLQETIEQTLMSIIYSQDDGQISDIKGNMSSMVVDQKYVRGRLAAQWQNQNIH